MILGDRGPGKTAIALDAFSTRSRLTSSAIYVVIGQRTTAVERVIEAVRERGAVERVVALASSAPGLQWIAPSQASPWPNFCDAAARPYRHRRSDQTCGIAAEFHRLLFPGVARMSALAGATSTHSSAFAMLSRLQAFLGVGLSNVDIALRQLLRRVGRKGRAAFRDLYPVTSSGIFTGRFQRARDRAEGGPQESQPAAGSNGEKGAPAWTKAATAQARRQALWMIAWGVAVLTARGRAFAVDKLEKSDVEYRESPKGRERCDNCRVWLPPGSCKSVEGQISPRGWCNIWRPAVVQNAIVPDPEERLTKDDVAYQNFPKGRQRCDNCDVFLPPDGCTSVQGNISPRGWCNIWRQAKMQP